MLFLKEYYISIEKNTDIYGKSLVSRKNWDEV